jgi:predicted CoA-binding protein
MSVSEASRKKTILIVGASDRPDRASHQLLQRLKARGGYELILVHPRLTEIDGMPVLASLSLVPPGLDLVTMYVNAHTSQGMEADLIRLQPRRVIFNPGAENAELLSHLSRQGIEVEEACSLVLLGQNAL